MNILSKLFNRELQAVRNVNLDSLGYYQCIYPTHTTFNTPTQHQQIVRFTPDGKYLICLSQQLHSVLVLEYHIPKSPLPAQFDDCFSKCYEKTMTTANEVFSSDFCIFTRNNCHMILASAKPSSNSDYESRYPNSLDCISSLDDISFWVVNILTGVVCHKLIYENDFIYLPNHSGVHLYNDFLAITSVKNQCIHILLIQESGKLVEVANIGWLNQPDDQLLLSLTEQNESDFQKSAPRQFSFSQSSSSLSENIPSVTVSNNVDLDFNLTQVPAEASRSRLFQLLSSHISSTYYLDTVVSEPVILSGLKQRIMSFLYKRALTSEDPNAISHFYLTFSYFSSLVMWRMQFLDSDKILIKFGSINNIAGRASDSTVAYTAFFVFYCISSTKVLGVYENSSAELYEMYENWDCFRPPANPDVPFYYTTTPSNNQYVRDMVRKNMYAVQKARNGGVAQSIKRVLSCLPYNPQSYHESPYFDSALYMFDEKGIGIADRTRICPDFPCKFRSRKTSKVKFKLDSNPTPNSTCHRSQRKFVSYVFHPFDPFVLSIQQSPSNPSVVNIHTRFEGRTSIRPNQPHTSKSLSSTNSVWDNLRRSKRRRVNSSTNT
ncbi:De-etiolated protein 1 Det1-domain-containing protein [Globomyces pollinis-pini]|nr:De-etiolated protein 1 Det1-domain-containing protein [Globomyces pollinis-pini]